MPEPVPGPQTPQLGFDPDEPDFDDAPARGWRGAVITLAIVVVFIFLPMLVQLIAKSLAAFGLILAVLAVIAAVFVIAGLRARRGRR
jgi:Na+/melibiose symporter-like transporter